MTDFEDGDTPADRPNAYHESPSTNSSDGYLASIDTGPAVNAKHEAYAGPTAHDGALEDILPDMSLLFSDTNEYYLASIDT